MDNNSVDKKPGMEAAEETVILDAIENYIAASTIEATTNSTIVDMETTGVEVENKLVRVEITGVGIKNPGVQDTLHEVNRNDGKDDDMSKIADEDRPEEDLHHPQITSPTQWCIYNLMPRKPRRYSKHLGLDDYANTKILHYAMIKYLIRKGLKKSKKVGEEEVEKDLNQLHTKNYFSPINVANMIKKEKGYALELLMILKEKCDRNVKG